jgi:hypothetical protein
MDEVTSILKTTQVGISIYNLLDSAFGAIESLTNIVLMKDDIVDLAKILGTWNISGHYAKVSSIIDMIISGSTAGIDIISLKQELGDSFDALEAIIKIDSNYRGEFLKAFQSTIAEQQGSILGEAMETEAGKKVYIQNILIQYIMTTNSNIKIDQFDGQEMYVAEYVDRIWPIPNTYKPVIIEFKSRY